MPKKILLASGCSYTDKDYKSNDPNITADWPMWPEIMANNLNLKCVNTGKCGQGADHIFDSIMDNIATYGNRIDTIAIVWSTADRIPFFDFTLNPIVECNVDEIMKSNGGVDPFSWMDDIGIGRISKNYMNSAHFGTKKSYKIMIQNPLRKMLAIVEICKAKNIKFVMIQGLLYMDTYSLDSMISRGILNKQSGLSPTDCANLFMKNPIFGQLEKHKKHIIGWPFLPKFGGYVYDDIRFGHLKLPNRTISGPDDYYISNKDKHPNKLGQELLSDLFMEKYKELYH